MGKIFEKIVSFLEIFCIKFLITPLRKSLLYYSCQDVKQADLVEILGLSKATISRSIPTLCRQLGINYDPFI
jgi:preprotein translocase subunit Sec63